VYNNFEKKTTNTWRDGGVRLNLHSMVYGFNIQLNTKRHISKAFLSPFLDGIAMAQTLARQYAISPYTASLQALTKLSP